MASFTAEELDIRVERSWLGLALHLISSSLLLMARAKSPSILEYSSLSRNLGVGFYFRESKAMVV